MGTEQPQDPLATDADRMLAAQPSPDLAVALASERRVGQHPADQPHQLVVADRGQRPGSCPRTRHPDAAGVDGRAGRTQHPTHHRQRQLMFHGYLGRFAGGIDSPLFSAAARNTSFSMVNWPILRSASLSTRSSGPRSDRWPFNPCLPAARKSSRQAASRCASTLSSRDNSSSGSPPAAAAPHRPSSQPTSAAGPDSPCPAHRGCSPS